MTLCGTARESVPDGLSIDALLFRNLREDRSTICSHLGENGGYRLEESYGDIQALRGRVYAHEVWGERRESQEYRGQVARQKLVENLSPEREPYADTCLEE